MAFGIAPGMRVKVHQHYPTLVIQCEHTQLAMEEIAGHSRLARAGRGRGGTREPMILDDAMPEYEPGSGFAPSSSRSARSRSTAHLPLCTTRSRWSRSAAASPKRTGVHLARRSPTASAAAAATTRAPSDHHGDPAGVAIDLVRDFHRQGMRAFVLISGHAGKTHVLTLVDAGEQLLVELPDIRVSVISVPRDPGGGQGDRRGRTIRTPARSNLARPVFTPNCQRHLPAEWPVFPDAARRDKRRHWRGGVWGDPASERREGPAATEIAVVRAIELIRELEDYRETTDDSEIHEPGAR
jgi:creatinine amidohydrolase